MARPDRRYDGDPHFPIEKVRACISVSQFRVSRKAQYQDGPRVLPPGTLDVFGTIKEITAGLDQSNWRFAQEKDGQWVDIYEVHYGGAGGIWLKIKIEQEMSAKEFVIVISFHEWDYSRNL